MVVFDCNLSYGKYVSGGPEKPCNTLGELEGELVRAGIAGGFVYHAAMDTAGVVTGNALLAGDLENASQKLWGVWSLLPSCTGEIPGPQDLPAAMRQNGIAALRLNPQGHKYLPLPAILDDYLALASERNIPIRIDTGCGVTLEQAYAYLAAFPKLTCILTHADCWPCDRQLRPFLERFENVVLDTTYLLTDQGFEEIVRKYGASRLLFGSGFPACYLGAHLLTLFHSDISQADKQAILGGNLERLVKGANLT